jgi:4-amino-4-deoxy-L-arabinose transferase-like glycosyltransferase
LQRLRRWIRSEWFVLLVVTALAAALRLYALDRLPAGLYHDEAYNGLDALDIIRGARPIFFEANNGREPLFIYLVSIAVALLGRNPLAIRIVSALLGTLTVPAAYAMARELKGRRVALLSAVVTALTFWHLNLSRLGFRAVSLPLFIALALWWFARGLHRREWHNFALAGLFLGLAQYTYVAARFVIIAFAVLSVYLFKRRRAGFREVGILFAVALLVALPLLVYFGRHLDAFLARSAQVSVFNPDINGGDLLGTLARHAVKTLGMFNWRGDFIPRHNLPYRPVFDSLMGVIFLLGVVVAVRRARQEAEAGLVLLYSLVMLVPTVLAEDAPHFLRSVGILPVIMVFPAIGLASLYESLRGNTSKVAAALAVVVTLGWSGSCTVRDYFLRHVSTDAVYYNFETGAVDLAADINAFIGTGWQRGAPWLLAESVPSAQRAVHLDERLWRDWPSLRYLVPETPGLRLLAGDRPRAAIAEEVQVVVWPYDGYARYLPMLPREHVISVSEGPLERGDLELQPRRLCLTYTALPASNLPSNLQASFEHGIELIGYELQAANQATQLRLYWRAGQAIDADYSVFVHWNRGGQPLTQSDSFPAQGYYPTHLWRPGDIVVDAHVLAAAPSSGKGDALSVGLYQLQTMRRLQVLDGDGNPAADSVSISLP